MANAENGLVSPELVGGQPAPGRTRSGKPAGPAFKPMQRDDVDADKMAALMELYDDSFRNMAEGEVVKGTVLRVTESAVVVDVGYKSEGLIAISEFLDESGQVTVQAFLFGNGLMNTLTPTSGMLLAYLAAGKVSYGAWIRFVMPLALMLLGLCAAALLIAVAIGL